MLKKLTIRNFQTHKKLTIDFDPHINMITGSTDIGKSSIIRALSLVTINSPRGRSFIRNGTKETSITLQINNHKIKRKRGVENTYELDGKKYVAFGKDVPEDIRNVLHIEKENFQNQHDPPFWFSKSAGEVSRQLNRIINLDVIDSTMSNISSVVRNAQASLSTTETRLAKSKEDKKQLFFVVRMNEDLQKVISLEETKEKTRFDYALLDDLTRTYTQLHIKRETLLHLNQTGLSTLSKRDKTNQTHDQMWKLKDLLEKIKQYTSIINKKPKSLKHLQFMQTSIKENQKIIDTLCTIISRMENGIKRKQEAKNIMDILSEKLKKTMKERCPICGRKRKS